MSSGARISALAFLAGVVILVGAGPASAVSEESSASPLVGSGVIATCPTGSGGDVAGGSPTIGIVTVGDPAGGRCAPHAAAADGIYEVGAIGEDEGLRFSSDCTSSGVTFGAVDVPAGSIVNGQLVTEDTTVVTPNTPVVFPNGETAIVNQVVETPTSITRNAIAFDNGTIVGQVVCGAVAAYPLVVDGGGAGGDISATARPSATGAGDGSATTALIGAGLVLALLAQVAIARRVRSKRAGATS